MVRIKIGELFQHSCRNIALSSTREASEMKQYRFPCFIHKSVRARRLSFFILCESLTCDLHLITAAGNRKFCLEETLKYWNTERAMLKLKTSLMGRTS